jgi:cytochrome c oxidase assembly protein subunit 11
VQVAVVAGMIGFTYFSVPLYRLFCAATGYGGTVAEGQTVEAKLKKRIENPDIPTEEYATTH